jgi:hypothetical protein
MTKQYLAILFSLIIRSMLFAQYSQLSLSKRQQQYTDSLKKVEYNHTFPIMGQKAYKMGFDVPYPVGVMTNYFYAKQGLILENMQLGLKTNNQDTPLTPVDFTGFKNNTVTAKTFNVRPDLWILPFLDLYGIFGYGTSTTTVNLTTPVTLTSIVTQNVSTAGFGITGAFGVGPLFVVLDGNWTWNKPEKLDKPVNVKTFSLRLGHTFRFTDRPERNIGIWAGAMRARMGSGTVGEIALSDALPASVWQKKDEIVQQYNAWYNGLNPANPADKIKMGVADKVLTPIIQKIDAADGSATIRYAFNKRPVQEWNMIVGGQFQLNKRWMFRTEGGIVGDRKSFLLSANYRFMAF